MNADYRRTWLLVATSEKKQRFQWEKQMADENVIPFGKYKGQPIDQVAARDPQYLQWLTQQAWFVEKFQSLVVNINNFGAPPEETPAHNAMQVRFLAQDYRTALVSMLNYEKKLRGWLVSQSREGLKRCHVERKPSWYRRHPDYVKRHRERVREAWDNRRSLRQALALLQSGHHPKFTIDCSRVSRFEERYDVIFEADFTSQIGTQSVHDRDSIAVEIKPSMGDDFPAVLRQIKRQKPALGCAQYRGVLLLGEYAGTGATLDQVRQVFAADGVTVVLAADVETELTKIQQGEQP